MDAGLLQSIVVALENVLTTRYLSAAGYVVLLYDHLLTLDDEVKYIWSAPTTIAKILFLTLRYMVPLFLTGETITRSGLVVIPMSDATYAGWISITISNFLVLLRIWTTLPRGHRLITWSLVFFIFMQLGSFAVTTWVISNMIPVLFFDPVAGFCSFSAKPNVAGLWIPGLIFEVVVFVTICWNALDRPRALGTDSETHITRLLFRDGVIYFIILFVLRVANTVLALVAHVSLIFVAVYFIWAGTTITTNRLIINSRRAVAETEQRREVLLMAEAEAHESVADDLQLDQSVNDLQSIDQQARSRNASYVRWSKGGSFWAT
ncbi:hypothetical protein DFH08DRAFT_1051043 [Mycena albidolilacea]|uniref:DUF6533 domain-containing protein n=1 Tax=Mycena albidolilacea TaxID=1033008 RepID=A0AAD6Z6G1_9AGAR|nr:hypothetical protein DFH08DRAFT_1051043 [Mycena albidolilacea]